MFDNLVKTEVSPPLSVRSREVLVAVAIALGVLSYFISRVWSPPPAPRQRTAPPPLAFAAEIPSEEATTESAIRFYKARVGRDPEDTRSQNALAEYYLQLVRETGNEDYLPLALTAARASLAAVGSVRNLGGLTALAHAEFANHAFAQAHDHTLELLQFQPRKSEPYAILGDAYLELGSYDEAAAAYHKMQSFGENDAGMETRLARLDFLRGSPDGSRQHFMNALALLRAQPEPPAETVAWCQWQLGETAFAVGDYGTAESHDREALRTAPDYFRALGSLGRVRAARGDLVGAITYYERAVRIVPALGFMASLGDLYQMSGRNRDAAVQYDLAEQMGEHSRKVHGSPFDRNLALFYADHDRNAEMAYELAQKEYAAGRHDIYGAEALAWTALKSSRITEAQAAMREALRLGTRDARLFYHAGMIARASGDKATGAAFLQRALALNPNFDPLQSEIARKAQR